MSKHITFEDLKKALEPLANKIDNVAKSQEKNSISNTELYALFADVSAKLDIYINRENPEVKKKTPVKKTSKKNVEEVKEDKDDETDDKGDSDKEETDEETTAVKAPVKKTPTKKTPAKKTPTKKESKDSPKEKTEYKPLDKGKFFAKMYDENKLDMFKIQLTTEVINRIDKENKEEWDVLKPADKNKARRIALYTYMKDNYDSVLQSMKNSYNEENKPKEKLIEKEEDDE